MKTPDTLEVKLAGTPHSLLMSYGLLNRLTVLVGGPEQIAMIGVSPDLQEKVLIEVFTVRARATAPKVPESLDEIELSLDDISATLDWVSGHINDFFLRTIQASSNRALDQQKALAPLQKAQQSLSQLTDPGSLG